MNLVLAPVRFPAADPAERTGTPLAPPPLRAADGAVRGVGSSAERIRYLAGAADHADLERRVRVWEQHERIVRSLPLAL